MPKVDISIELLSATPDAEKHIERCGREAYGSPESKTIEGTRNWIRKRINGYEHDVLEHASATFLVVGSRVYSHEQVRHRLASYTQRSMRFTESAVTDYICPPEVKPDDVGEWCRDIEAIMQYYDKWKAKGYARQTARYMLPNAMATSIAITANFREWRHFITMRSGTPAQPEMRHIAQEIYRICLEKWPSIFEDLNDELKKRGWV